MKNKMVAMTLILALFCVTGAANAVEPDSQQCDFIQAECQKYGLSSTLVYGVIMAESGFNPLADSGSSKGIMQLNKNTYPALAEALGMADFDVFDFEDNVQAGIYHLANLRDYWTAQGYLDEEVFALMLISYNRGIAGCRKYVEQNGPENDYVDQVLSYKYQQERRMTP